MRIEPTEFANKCYCLNLRQVTAGVIRLYDMHLADAGITIQQFSILEFIRGMSPVSVTDLASAMKLDRTTLSRNLKILKSADLINDVEAEGRRRQVVLSEHGKETLLKAEKLWDKAQSEFETIFGSQQEVGKFRQSLHLLKEKV